MKDQPKELTVIETIVWHIKSFVYSFISHILALFHKRSLNCQFYHVDKVKKFERPAFGKFESKGIKNLRISEDFFD